MDMIMYELHSLKTDENVFVPVAQPTYHSTFRDKLSGPVLHVGLHPPYRSMLMTACDISAITKPWPVQKRVGRGIALVFEYQYFCVTVYQTLAYMFYNHSGEVVVEKQQYIAVGTVMMFLDPSAKQACSVVHQFPYTTKIARIRCYKIKLCLISRYV